ncbi:MAG: energy transducer TonB [Spirochaetes bacterium]|nr:energy transducer TonB [Spirochaetota bacterium]
MNDHLLRRILRYLRLRPALSWSIASLAAFLALMPVIQWYDLDDDPDRGDDSDLVIVEMSLPALQEDVDIPEPVKQMEEAITEAIAEEIRFGEDSPEFIEITPAATAPQLRFSRLPPYPDSMRSAGTEGVVVVEIGIDETGRVLFGRIVGSLGREFDLAVIKWVRELKFYPALDSSRRPFRCRVRLPVRFTLER